MRAYITYITLLVMLVMSACHGRGCEDHEYQVTCTMHRGTIACDSATLLVLDDDYGCLRVLGGAQREDSTFSFVGHTRAAQIAMVRFETDSLPRSFYFILEPTAIHIDIKCDRWIINGGEQNRLYQLFLNRHARLNAQRDSLWRQYVSQGTVDSTLTWNTERQMLDSDSLLQDSLQRITVQRINQGDLPARLIRQRLLPTLTSESLQQLKQP